MEDKERLMTSEASTFKNILQRTDRDFKVSDIFWWRDAPDWYYKTFLAAGMGLSYSTLKCYVNRHELEVFLPPRSAVLPSKLQQGYRDSQILKYGFLKVGRETTLYAGAAAIFYSGAYYLGEHRGQHTWENFAASGALSGVTMAAWLMRPMRPRLLIFGALLGSGLGAAASATTQALGIPFWREGHDFEGWWFGSLINLKESKKAAALARQQEQQQREAQQRLQLVDPGCPGAALDATV